MAKKKTTKKTKTKDIEILPPEKDSDTFLSKFMPSATDIENLNTESLQKIFSQGLYVLQAALYAQSGYEFNRLSKLQTIVDRLETEIFDEDKLKDLTFEQQMLLYSTLTKNMEMSLKFLQVQHKNAIQSSEVMKKIEQMSEKSKNEKPSKVMDSDSADAKELKAILEAGMLRKIEEREK